MNKTGLFICLAISIVYSARVSAQNEIAYASNDFHPAFTSNVYLNEISRNAYRHFEKNYSFASGEEWKKYKGGYLVVFTTSDSVLYRVYYDRSGRFSNAMTYYQKDHLPGDLTASIPIIYKDYTVLNASGMDDGLKMTYEVSLVKDNLVKVMEISGRDVKPITQYMLVP